MNKHIETINFFKKTTPLEFKKSFQDLKQALWYFFKFLKLTVVSVFNIIVWCVLLILMVVALPVMTWFRLYTERKIDEDFKKQFDGLLERSAPVKKD